MTKKSSKIPKSLPDPNSSMNSPSLLDFGFGSSSDPPRSLRSASPPPQPQMVTRSASTASSSDGSKVAATSDLRRSPRGAAAKAPPPTPASPVAKAFVKAPAPVSDPASAYIPANAAAKAPSISPYYPFRSPAVMYLAELYASRGLYDIDVFDPEVLADLLMKAEIDSEDCNAHNIAVFQALEDSLAAAQATIQALTDAAASFHAPSSPADAFVSVLAFASVSRGCGESLHAPDRKLDNVRLCTCDNGSIHSASSHNEEQDISDLCIQQCASKVVSFQHSAA